MVLEHGHRLYQSAGADAERSFNDSSLTKDVIREVENASLPLAQSTHDLKALDCRVVGFQRFETTHKPDQLFQLAVIGLDFIVQILELAMLGVRRAFALRFQLRNNSAIGRSLVGINGMGLFPVFHPSQGFAQEPLGRLGIAGRGEIEIDGAAELVHGPVEIGPFSSDLDVRLINTPTATDWPASLLAQPFFISGA